MPDYQLEHHSLPAIQRLDFCPHDQQPMGSIRVYQGAGDPERRHLKGSIVQTVSIDQSLSFSAYFLTRNTVLEV